MSDAIIIFTFSPVQQFIAEARRLADLFTGSKILVELARAAGRAIGEDRLIYPQKLDADVPNKLVAVVPWEKAKGIAEKAHKALLNEWMKIADEAKKKLESIEPKPDDEWNKIWERQINNLWEVYWAAASLENRSYKDAFNEASRVLDAVKRTRHFNAAGKDGSGEDGLKDTLSGRRSALRIKSDNALSYWKKISSKFVPAKLRPDGRERLDAIGAVKRFCKIAETSFPSTSTVAAADFLELIRQHRENLADYRAAVEKLLKEHLYTVLDSDEDWPYDGDLLYMETLAEGRLRDSYGVSELDKKELSEAQKKLSEIYGKVGCYPSPYYAIIMLDGDKMGERIDKLLETENPEEEHKKFSGRLAEFAASVPDLIENKKWLVYNGGDDVLLLCPLSKAIHLANKLAQKFSETVGEVTASAGIAIVHHLYPLDASLSAARRAEAEAKRLRGKNAVCLHILKRSGEEVRIGSKWDGLEERFNLIVSCFKEKKLASKFAYDVLDEARIVTGLENKDACLACIKRLIKRHKSDMLSQEEEDSLLSKMDEWIDALDEITPKENNKPQGFAELGRWLVFAQFIAQGGVE
ncbi:MAG: type III-B CRISPR-associated protein Cas10/Cmr2 [Armatimonadota bacterium]|nr:type III-B CRISPR-associated protein Cas10/Cmr2 [Armatimonadota bacterium]